MDGIRVLLVDDEEEFTSVLSERMQTRGLIVDVSANGQDALTLANEETYDAVILDLAMPGMDGIETLKRLVKMNPDIQVILLTGHATLQKSVEAMKSGAMEFMEKPVKIDVLLEKIQQAHDKHEQLTETRIDDMLSDITKRMGW
ncbi:MAG TPA: response regulator [Bacteroidetes bacterium]|nr:transcriptional regulatory protein ZraR [bacterium BMS3Bbin04]HDO66221.1 response regulator [Bacteroidota bacterium]HEX05346.1 response regulator [Bacteroidota bacterium]